MNTVLVAFYPCGCAVALSISGNTDFTKRYEADGCTVKEMDKTEADAVSFPEKFGCVHGTLNQQLAARVKSLESGIA